jgi:hypothetical protein
MLLPIMWSSSEHDIYKENAYAIQRYLHGGGLIFQSSVYAHYKCLFSPAKSLQSLWMCEKTTAWNTCVLRAIILRPVEIFRGVILVCWKLYVPGGWISDCTRPLGGVSGFSVYKMSDYYCACSYHSRETRVCCFCLQLLLTFTSYNGRVLC